MFKKIFAAAALATIAASSHAATPGSVYAGLDVGGTESNDYRTRETSFGGFVGYNLNENVAVEGAYRRLASAEFSDVKRRLDQAAVSVLGTLPLSGGFGVFGRLGYNRVESSDNLGGPFFNYHFGKLLYGAGVSYNINGNISGRIEMQRAARNLTNLSAGVAYSF